MSRKSIEPRILEPVVSDASTLFTTKDISEDTRVRNAYPELAAHRNYHAFVGGALSDHHVELGIEKVRITARPLRCAPSPPHEASTAHADGDDDRL